MSPVRHRVECPQTDERRDDEADVQRSQRESTSYSVSWVHQRDMHAVAFPAAGYAAVVCASDLQWHVWLGPFWLRPKLQISSPAFLHRWRGAECVPEFGRERFA